MSDSDRAARTLAALASYGGRLTLATTLEDVFEVSLTGIEELLGFAHSLVLVHQPETGRLVTVASHGYESGGAGSEVTLGEGLIGMVGARRQTMRIGNLQRMLSYARTVRRSAADADAGSQGDEIPLPGLADARSQLAAPMVARGVLVGVLAVESSVALAYDEFDEHALGVAAHLVAGAIEREEFVTLEAEPQAVQTATDVSPTAEPGAMTGTPVTTSVLRHYAVDGSTFIDDGYVIKGVAGRLLWKVVSAHSATGRTSFTNREAKLDPTLGLPAYRDNFESRLILLKRRLEEHEAPVRIHSAGRGRFELELQAPISLELISP
jgi:putative methionine-R-sulfoxide reductase with GAF domain